MNKNNGCFSIINGNSCGCEGTDVLTPLPHNNRPGLSALSYRIGTHASFLESMKARLSSAGLAGNMTEEAKKQVESLAEQLKNGLTARDSSDPSIALLDAWAVVADVLTFYQERIANEGYLRTATEERSIHELSRLVGFRQRTGVAASTVLAYTIDPNTKGEVVIPAGSRVQSVPGQNELPQTFESSEDLKAYAELNMLKPRMSKAQRKIDIFNSAVYLSGINTNLKQDDRILIEAGSGEKQLYRVVKVVPDAEAKRTCVELQIEYPTNKAGEWKILKDSWNQKEIESIKFYGGVKAIDFNYEEFIIIDDINRDIYISIKNTTLKKGERIVVKIKGESDELVCSVKEDVVATADDIYIKFVPVKDVEVNKIYAFRAKTAPFGHNAPLKPFGMLEDKVMKYVEWQINNPTLAPDKPKISFNHFETILPDGLATIILTNTSINKEFIEKIKWIWRIGNEKNETDFFDNTSSKFNTFSLEKQNRGSIIHVTLMAEFVYKFIDGESVVTDEKNITVSRTVNVPIIVPPKTPYIKEGDIFLLNFTAETDDALSVNWKSDKGRIRGVGNQKTVEIEYDTSVVDIVTLSTSDLSSACSKEIRVCDPPTNTVNFSIANVNDNYFDVNLTSTSSGIIDKIEWKNGNNTNIIGEMDRSVAVCRCEYNKSNYDIILNISGPGGIDNKTHHIDKLFFFSKEKETVSPMETIVFTNRSIGDFTDIYFIFMDTKKDSVTKKTFSSGQTEIDFQFSDAGECLVIMIGIINGNIYRYIDKITVNNTTPQ